MPSILRWPAQIAKRILQPIALRMVGRHLERYFVAGEKVLASDLTSTGKMWAASNYAVYIEARHGPEARLLRIPYERIVSIEETRNGHKVRRVLRCFPLIGGYQISETGTDVTPFGDVVQEHIDALVIERKTLHYEGHRVSLVCRKVEPDHHAHWYLEQFEAGADSSIEEFNSWVELTLQSLNRLSD